ESVRVRLGMFSRYAVITAKRECREIACHGRPVRKLSGALFRERGLVIRARSIRALQRLIHRGSSERLVQRFVRQLELLAGSESDHAGERKFLNRKIVSGGDQLLLAC